MIPKNPFHIGELLLLSGSENHFWRKKLFYMYSRGWELSDTVNYLDALKLQEKVVAGRNAQKITDTILSLRHPPTVFSCCQDNNKHYSGLFSHRP
ncbi:Octanoyltransferase LIP2, mitochondrial-like protein [Drosera capensis]